MTASSFLKSVEKLENFIIIYESEYASMRILAENPKISELTENKIQTSRKLTGQEDAVVRLEEYKAKIDKLLRDYVARRNQLIELLDKMPNSKHALIIYKRCIEHAAFCEIADSLDISVSYAKSMYSRACKEFDKIFRKTVPNSTK